MSAAGSSAGVVFHEVSKFYGEVLGVNRVSLALPPGITSLVGPNGAGKSTLMNLLAGLIQPTRGRIEVLGVTSSDPERMFRLVGYSSQFDSFPRGLTAQELLSSFLRLAGKTANVERMAVAALERVGLAQSAKQKLASLSKGNRQRARLALALALEPPVMILDEPLNGLDPLARAEAIALFQRWAGEGKYVILSSHVLHEVDAISDQVVMLSNGYVVAEGAIQGVREELPEHPLQVYIRCRRARELAGEAFQLPSVSEAQLLESGLLVTTRDPRELFLALNRWALANFGIEGVHPADEDAHAVYEYLVQPQGSTR
ncbi:MAG: ABC transporter ATP-binding protein [Terriglobales bacterium]